MTKKLLLRLSRGIYLAIELLLRILQKQARYKSSQPSLFKTARRDGHHSAGAADYLPIKATNANDPAATQTHLNATI